MGDVTFRTTYVDLFFINFSKQVSQIVTHSITTAPAKKFVRCSYFLSSCLDMYFLPIAWLLTRRQTKASTAKGIQPTCLQRMDQPGRTEGYKQSHLHFKCVVGTLAQSQQRGIIGVIIAHRSGPVNQPANSNILNASSLFSSPSLVFYNIKICQVNYRCGNTYILITEMYFSI